MSKPVMMIPVLAALCLSGCGADRPPTVAVTDARVVASSDEAVVIEFTLAAKNENDEGLPLQKIDYAVTLEGRTVFSGTRSPEATIRRESDQVIRIPASVKLPPGERSGRPYAITGRLTYREPGKIAEILFEYEVVQPSVGFSGNGTIDLASRP